MIKITGGEVYLESWYPAMPNTNLLQYMIPPPVSSTHVFYVLMRAYLYAPVLVLF